MGPADVTNPEAVLQAIREYDQYGRDEFLKKYKFFSKSRKFVVIHEGREYDSKPLLAAAHGYQYPDKGPLPNNFSGGEQTTSRFRALGFEIRSPKKSGSIVRFGSDDCQIFERYQSSVPWNTDNVPEADQEKFKSIWQRLKELSAWLSENVRTDVPLKPSTSQYQANGRTQNHIWSCIYPASVPNKSYGLQVAIIISAKGAEVCICLGAGKSQLKDRDLSAMADQSLSDLRARLSSVPPNIIRELERTLPTGAQFLTSWRGLSDAPPFTRLEEWLAYAAGPDGAQSSISTFLSSAELDQIGTSVADVLLAFANAAAPLLEYCYLGEVSTPEPAAVFDLESLEELAAALPHALNLDMRVYRSVVAAIRSGKHIILTGPPGTAKTTLAEVICQLATRAGLCSGYTLTTATADWTTYETIGGLRPGSNGGLEFRDGQFLKAIRDDRWLVIDEMNRSNFDRAFGQLFTVLSKQSVVLPYEIDNRPIVLLPQPVILLLQGETGQYESTKYDIVTVPDSWRIIATMNVFDKSLLFEMSFALMRRFAFIEVPAPPREVFEELWMRELKESLHDNVSTLHKIMQGLYEVVSVKDVGPATFRDMARFAREYASKDSIATEEQQELAIQLFYGYLLPQFEGISPEKGRDLFQKVLPLVGQQNEERLRRTMSDVLGLGSFSTPTQEHTAFGE